MAQAVTCGVPLFLDPGPFFGAAPQAFREQALACATALLLTESEIPAVTGGAGRPGRAARPVDRHGWR